MLITLLLACGTPEESTEIAEDDALMCSLEKRGDVCYRVAVAKMQPPEDWVGADRAMDVACSEDFRDACERWVEVSKHRSTLGSLYRNGLPLYCKDGNANACAAYLVVEPNLDRETPEDRAQIRALAAKANPSAGQ